MRLIEIKLITREDISETVVAFRDNEFGFVFSEYLFSSGEISTITLGIFEGKFENTDFIAVEHACENRKISSIECRIKALRSQIHIVRQFIQLETLGSLGPTKRFPLHYCEQHHREYEWFDIVLTAGSELMLF